MNRLERIYHIHHLLLRGRPVPISTFEKRIEKSRSTIKRDIEYMRDYFQAPVIYDATSRGYRYDEDAGVFELPGFWLSQQELYALRILQEVSSSENESGIAPLLAPVRHRVDALLQKHGHDPETIANRIRVLPLFRRRLSGIVFKEICAALLNNRVLRIRYHARTDDKIRPRRIHPQQLIHYRDNWYLVAHCDMRCQLRTFSVDRISIVSRSEEKAIRVADDKLHPILESSFGLFLGAASQTAVLRFRQPEARWVADEIWHPDQITKWDKEDLLLTIPYNNPTELLREILRIGPGVKVESPPALIDAVIRALKKNIAQYER